jgi:hypothetical protein
MWRGFLNTSVERPAQVSAIVAFELVRATQPASSRQAHDEEHDSSNQRESEECFHRAPPDLPVLLRNRAAKVPGEAAPAVAPLHGARLRGQAGRWWQILRTSESSRARSDCAAGRAPPLRVTECFDAGACEGGYARVTSERD